jgi:hypothetical protein
MSTLTDQQIRDAGILYLPMQEYLANPFLLPEGDQEDGGDGGGGVNLTRPTNVGGSGISTLPAGKLMVNFEDAISSRQNRLTNPDLFAQKLYDMGLPKQRSVDQMIRDATAFNMAQLGPDFSQIGITSNMTGPEIRQAMAEYAADETSIGNYPVDDPRDVRTNLPFGITGILSRVLPSSYYDKMTVPEQIYTQSKIGYTGPTVFGENTTGGSKDIFGRNIISAFGNYPEKQKSDIAKLDNYFESELFDKRYGDDTKLVFDETIGQFVFKGPGAEAATRMNRLNLLRYNYDKQGLKEFEDIKDQTGFTEVEEARKKEIATTPGKETGSGGREVATDAGAVAGAQQDISNYQSFGEVPLKKGGLAGVLGY